MSEQDVISEQEVEDAKGFVLFLLFCFVFSTVCLAVRWNEKVFGFFWDEPPFFLFRGQKNKVCFLECLLLQIAYRSKTSGETCHSFPVKCVLWFSFLCENEQRSKDAKDFVSLSCFVFLSREMKTCMPEVFFGMGLFSFSVSWSKSKVSFKFSVNSKFIFLKI